MIQVNMGGPRPGSLMASTRSWEERRRRRLLVMMVGHDTFGHALAGMLVSSSCVRPL
jgi:hypothetical protein